MKACSTLVALLALVSKNGMLSESANSYAQRHGTSKVMSKHASERPRAQVRFTDLCSTKLDLPFRGQVGLVAHKETIDTLASVPMRPRAADALSIPLLMREGRGEGTRG